MIDSRSVMATLCAFFLMGSPLQASLPVPSNVVPQEDNLKIIRDGQESHISFYNFASTPYLSIDQLAKLAEAQLRWQAVTEQACLSNSQGLLCFNWGQSQIVNNDRVSQRHVPLRFENNQLFIPLSYVPSNDFQSFCDTQFHWNEKDKTITQVATVTLGAPQVERLSDRYQMRFHTPEKGSQYLIEKSDKRIWIRFVRAHTAGSQIFDGDDVIREVKIVQRRRSADLIVSLGDRVNDSDVYFDDDANNLVIDVFSQASSALMAKKPAKKWSGKKSVPVKKNDVSHVVTKLPSEAANSASRPIVRDAHNGLLTIVVDAGHGGMDAGAIGPRGTLEKNINLEVAKALAKQLKKEKNIQVVMTREGDEFVPLNERTDIANAAKADLFVSIHCNSSLSSKNLGFETYFLSPDATDKAAESVARLENSVVALEAKKGASSAKLESLLASMAVHDQINESSRFASMIVRSVKQISGQDKAAVKEADFFVLRGAQMPAVLVELEYLSHPISESKLRSSRFRGNLVKGLVDGILTFDKQVRREQEKQAAQITSQLNKTDR